MFPLIIGNILQQFYNTIDSLIVGRYVGSTAFAAVGVAGSVMNLFIFMLNGGCNGISVVFAELYRQKKWDRLRKGLSVMFTLAIVLSALMILVTRTAVVLLMGNPNKAVLDHAGQYMLVVSIFYFLCFIGSAFVGFYRGIGKIEVPVIGTILQISIRVVLSYVWIRIMGLKAVALAMGIGWIAVVVYQVIIYKIRIQR